MEFARRVYGDLVDALLARGARRPHGVFRKRAFGIEHRARGDLRRKGPRTCRQTVMDDPAANPEYYRDASPAQAVGDTATLIKEVEAIGRASKQGIWPVITPRFIPSCTDEVLRGLWRPCGFDGSLRANPLQRGPMGARCGAGAFWKTDPYALRDFGLVNERTIVAHSCPRH